MNPAPKQPDQSTYSGRLAARLRALREKVGLTVEQVVEAMAASGYEASAKSIYNWEAGIREAPYNALPALAEALKLKTIRALMPEK